MSLSPIAQTQNWVSRVIVGFNFCPFAKKEVVNNTIKYLDSQCQTHEDAVLEMLSLIQIMHEDTQVETCLQVFSQGFIEFDEFLALIDLANAMLVSSGYEGFVQIAHFHPDYVFADSDEQDPANYTNRSPYPTLHLIREASMARVLDIHPDPDGIPENNIELTREKGIEFWQKLLRNCQTKI